MEKRCVSCPRNCMVNRNNILGYCQSTNLIKIARISPHYGEEPCISGKNGSGTIFFSGCNLKCIYCQNIEISHGQKGVIVTSEELEKQIYKLQDLGVHNINLVTPTHFIDFLIPILKKTKKNLKIPIVYNTSGYDKKSKLKELEGIIDIYLTDFKYLSNDLSAKYSDAPDYSKIVSSAIEEMIRQQPITVFDSNHIMQKGVIIRHLILPGCRKDSISIMHYLKEHYSEKSFLLSLMNQYTPIDCISEQFHNLKRKITKFEYNSVLKEADKLGLNGFCQSVDSSGYAFIPDFNEKLL